MVRHFRPDQAAESERPPEVVGQEGAEPSLGESGLRWSFCLGNCKPSLDFSTGHQSSVPQLDKETAAARIEF